MLGQRDPELVGYELAVAVEQLRLGVELALQPGGDLHRLDVALEGAREGAADGVLELLLDAVKDPHPRLLSMRSARSRLSSAEPSAYATGADGRSGWSPG